MAAPPPPPQWQPQQEGVQQILQLLTEYRMPGVDQQQVRPAPPALPIANRHRERENPMTVERTVPPDRDP